jgi:hypothetical protein
MCKINFSHLGCARVDWNHFTTFEMTWLMCRLIKFSNDASQQITTLLYTAISIKVRLRAIPLFPFVLLFPGLIKVVYEQSGKVEYERERLLGIVNKLMNFQSDSQQPFALVFDFSALLVDNLN